MAQATRKQRVNLLNHKLPRWGPGDILTIRPEHIREIMKGFRPTPGQANNLLKALRAMFAFAKEENIISDNPTKGVSRYKMPSGGFTAWTNDHLNAFLSAHALGTTPHLAMMLLIGTACRRSDLVLLGPRHIIEQHGQRSLTFVHAKHGFAEESRVTVPILRGLEEALAATQTGEETFLTTEQGRPFSKHGFGDQFRKWCDAAGLPTQLSAHGVRKAVGARFADVGCTPHEIMAVHGHTNALTSEIYTKTANRKTLAANAAAKVSLDDLLGEDDEDI